MQPFLRSALVLCLAASASARAAWLNDVPIQVEQPDGSRVPLFVSGDEYYNWVHDADGYVIVRAPNTSELVYATRRNGTIVPTTYQVGRVNPSRAGLTAGIRPDPGVILARRARRSFMPPADLSLMGEPDGPQPARPRTINNIVVFMRFSDESEYSTPVSSYENMLNSTTLPSLLRYYQEASYGQLSITSTMYPTTAGSTIVSYQDTEPRNFYRPFDTALNPIGYKNDNEVRLREHDLLRRAINAVKSQIPASLDLDTNGDGNVDNIVFVASGSPGAWSSLLWPHAWALYTYNVFLNGVRVWSYNFQLNNVTGTSVLAHEAGHTLGMPDLYRYNSGVADVPIGGWDVMAANLTPPQHMSAYMKWRYLKWIDAIPEITTSGVYTLNPLTSSFNNCYKIRSPQSTTEYFVVEYRRKTGMFESSLYGSGLLVYRVNTAADKRGNAQGPPDELYVYRPGGTTTSNGSISLAHFSASVGRTQITDTSYPSGFLSNGSPGGLAITNIGAAGDTISFRVTIAGQDPAQVRFATIIGDNARAGEILPFPVRVGLMDASNRIITTATGPVTVSLSPDTGDPAATLLGTKTVHAVAGIAQFWDLRVDKPGAGYRLTATYEGTSSGESGLFSVLPFTFRESDAADALRYASGVEPLPAHRLPTWDVVSTGASAGRVDIEDVAAIVRKVAGLEPNP